jgi:WD40 repeat protein
MRRLLLALNMTLLCSQPLLAAAPPVRSPGGPLPAGASARLTPDRGSGAIACVAVSPDGRTVAAGRTGEGVVWIWEIATGRSVHRLLPAAGARVTALTFSPDGKTLAVGAGINPGAGLESGDVFLYDVAGGKKFVHVQAHPRHVWTLAFAPDGKTLATGGDEPNVRLWEVRTGKPIREMRSDNRHHRASCWSPDGKLLAAGGDGAELTLWDPANGEVVRDCVGRPGEIDFVCFSRDGQKVVWTSRRRIVHVHDTATAEQLARYGSDNVSFNAFALSPDGSILATADKKGQVRLWDVQSSHQLTIFPGHRGEATALAFASNGSVLISGGQHGDVLVWGMKDLTRQRAGMLWRLLASDMPEEFQQGEARLKNAEMLPLMRERLEHFFKTSASLPRLLAELDADEFVTREAATERLIRLGGLARAALDRLLASNPNLEVYRRAQRILMRVQDTVDEERSARRALAVLESLGSAEARNVLRNLSETKGESPLIRDARMALERLEAVKKR